MNEPISVGDLVMVVKPKGCCGNTNSIGKIFTISDIQEGDNYCRSCNSIRNSLDAEVGVDNWKEVKTLKRIPPLSELESIDQTKEVAA